MKKANSLLSLAVLFGTNFLCLGEEMKARKVVTIGSATKDVFVKNDEIEHLEISSKTEKKSYILLEEGKKISMPNVGVYTGGGSTNTAVSFKRLGFEVSAIFKIGNDADGKFILEELEKEGINVHAGIKDGVKTGFSFIIPSLSGDRTVFVHRGANAFLEGVDIPNDLIKNADLLYLTSLSGDSAKQLQPITQLAKQSGLDVAMNPGAGQLRTDSQAVDQLKKSLENIDILILNDDEAKIFMHSLVESKTYSVKQLHAADKSGSKYTPELFENFIYHKNIMFNLHQFFKEVLSCGPKIVVVTNGHEGAYVATKEITYFFPAIVPEKVASTLGAGDSFGSCFVACLSKGLSVDDSIINATINASSVVSFEDAKTGLLTWKELENKARNIDKSKLQKFIVS
ncbi:MAG: Carbohydrate/purine kinase pfkB family protein [candidate division TM6 bacterium GW2011_GWF2_32_72]|nr:MAG: Carbohydrate/purine kinase pfkB family protein [candidate division TM6 bacterium GW2011_GWF2_32_72]